MKNSAWFLFAVGFLHITQTCASELLKNADFELDVDDWLCAGKCNLAASTDAYEGSGSAKVSERRLRLHGLAQRVSITGGSRFKLTGYIKLLNLAPGTLYESVTLLLTCSDSSNNDAKVRTKFGRVQRVRSGSWTKVGGFHYIESSLHTCQMGVLIENPEVNYLMDAMSLTEVPELTNWREEANAGIEELRKCNVTIQMVDSVPGEYTLEIEQTKHLFGFGSAVGASNMVDTEDTGNMNYQKFVFEHFEWAVLENALKWKLMEKTMGDINYERPDLAMTALKNKGIKIRGHNVFWGKEDSLPTWLPGLDITELKAEMAKRIQGVVNFTKGRLEQWDVNNENLHCDWYEQTLNDSDVTSQMFKDVNGVDPDVELYLNDYGVIQRDMAMGLRNQALYLKETGVPIHGIGIQSHLRPNISDITLLKHRLDTVAEANLPIWITELSFEDANATFKAEVLDEAMTMYFSHPAISGIMLWGFWDGKIAEPNFSLFEGEDITPNEAGQAYLNLREKWRTSETLVLSENGSGTVRGFKGDYSVVVKRDGEVVRRRTFSMDKDRMLNISVNR